MAVTDVCWEIVTELAAWHTNNGRPGHWYDDPDGLLAPQRLDDIAAARQRLSRSRQTETSGKIVAELEIPPKCGGMDYEE